MRVKIKPSKTTISTTNNPKQHQNPQLLNL